MYQDIKQEAFGTGNSRLDPAYSAIVKVHRVSSLGVASFILFTLITAVYFAYRIPLWNPAAPILSSLLLAAEMFGTFTLFLHIFSTWSLIERHAPPPPPGYAADIMITTWNESVEILRHTLLAAKQVSHVHEIWLLDDGCRPEMRELADELGVRYLDRVDRSHAKAGNLNNAMKYSTAEFIALFDCDHAPSPDFLTRTIGYFVDPRVAFVQTPQDFYNVDSFQHRGSAKTGEAWHEQTLFYRVIQPGKDRSNATFFCGSCAVLRRKALDDIGGIATGTITEDMHTSLKLHKNGWSAVYHAEALAFGMSPANLEQYETQRLRWGRGAMQVWSQEGIMFARGLTFAQRIAYLTSAITYFEGWQKAVVYFMPMVVLLTGSMPIIWTDWSFVGIFLLWFISGMIVNEIFSRGYAKTIWMEEYNLLRFFTFIKATLALVLPIKWNFSVTPKVLGIDKKERLRLWPQLTVALGSAIAIIIGGMMYSERQYLPQGAFIISIFWAALSGSLALKTLHFASGRMDQKRTEHRFPIPLAVRLTNSNAQKGEAVLAVAQDVSAKGLSLIMDPSRLPEGDVEACLILPSGDLPIRAHVMSIRPQFEKGEPTGRAVIGMRFEWSCPADADRLSTILYGNTLQWDVNGWAEVKKFSLVKLLARLRGKALASEVEWRLATVGNGKSRVLALTRREKDSFRIISYNPLPAMSGLRLRNRSGAVMAEELQSVGYREYQIGGASLHMAVLAVNDTYSPYFHREPKWLISSRAVA